MITGETFGRKSNNSSPDVDSSSESSLEEGFYSFVFLISPGNRSLGDPYSSVFRELYVHSLPRQSSRRPSSRKSVPILRARSPRCDESIAGSTAEESLSLASAKDSVFCCQSLAGALNSDGRSAVSWFLLIVFPVVSTINGVCVKMRYKNNTRNTLGES